MNDAPRFFSTTRGLCLGFPFSPLLFLLVTKVHNKLMEAHNSWGDIKGILFFEFVQVSHLLFVGDVLICLQGTQRNIYALEIILDTYKSIGMLIKTKKSAMICHEISGSLWLLSIHTFQFPIKSLEEGLKDLWFYLKHNKYRKVNWQWLIKKGEARILVWTHRLLSRGARAVLLEYVLENILVYWLSISYVLKGILNCIHWISYIFLWTRSRPQLSMALVKWPRLTAPKEINGWGLKNSFLFAKALASRILWRILTGKSIWTQVTVSKCFNGLSIIEWTCLRNKSSEWLTVWKALVASFPYDWEMDSLENW